MKKNRYFSLLIIIMLLFWWDHCRAALDTVTTLEDRLAGEVQKMIDAGHLRPAYALCSEHYSQYSTRGRSWEFNDYFHNPADTIYTLCRALPHLPSAMQADVLVYLQSEWNANPPYQYIHMGSSGAAREWFDLPPECTDFADFYSIQASRLTSAGGSWKCWSFNPFNIYACWMYARVFPAQASSILDQVRNKVTALPSEPISIDSGAYTLALGEMPHVLNQYIAGYIGYLNLQDTAGETRRSDVEQWLQTALDKRIAALSLPVTVIDGIESGGFLWCVPELGDYLNQNTLQSATANIQTNIGAIPYWFVAKFTDVTRLALEGHMVTLFHEGSMAQYYDVSSLFNAKAFVLKESREELELDIDVPMVWRGDLFYIQNLVSAIEAGNRPTAVLATTPVPPIGDAPLSVDFDATGSSDPDGSIVSYEWDFGDGNTAAGPTTSHEYIFPGLYTVRLVVTDNNDLTHAAAVDVVATVNGNLPPTAEFTFSPQTGYEPLDVSFDASGSYDRIGSIVSYAWDFGDGNTAAGATAGHTFEQSGTFAVTLTVTDDDGETGVATSPITVIARPPARPIPGRIEAEDYNVGGEGVGYHDTTPGNQGDATQFTDDVDVSVCPEGTFHIGKTAAAEWLAYDVDIAQTGTYDITARVSTTYTDDRYITVQIDGDDVATFVCNDTGGWTTYADVIVSDVTLTAGPHELRVVWSINGINLNYLDIDLQATGVVGDLDSDGDLDYEDLRILASWWLWTGAAGSVNADITPDGTVNFVDYSVLAGECTSDWSVAGSGDIDADGDVDNDDVKMLGEQWLWTGAAGAIAEDIIEDGTVDNLDFAELAGQWLD